MARRGGATYCAKVSLRGRLTRPWRPSGMPATMWCANLRPISPSAQSCCSSSAGIALAGTLRTTQAALSAVRQVSGRGPEESISCYCGQHQSHVVCSVRTGGGSLHNSAQLLGSPAAMHKKASHMRRELCSMVAVQVRGICSDLKGTRTRSHSRPAMSGSSPRAVANSAMLHATAHSPLPTRRITPAPCTSAHSIHGSQSRNASHCAIRRHRSGLQNKA